MSDTTTMMSREEPNWSDLPGDLLNMIGHRIFKLKDFTRFQVVCKPWRRALAVSRFRQSIPWLMLPHCRNSIGNSTSAAAARVGCKDTDYCRCFYDLEEQQFHHIELPQGLNKVCRGSAFGWVFMMERSPTLLLLNPLTNNQISLPPITEFPDVLGFRPEEVGKEFLYLDKDGLRVAIGKKNFEYNYIGKVCLSAEPTSEECVVMVIRMPDDYTLAFCRPNRSQKWTLIPRGDGVVLRKLIPFKDAVFWRGQFYVLTQDGEVYVCDLSLPHCPKLSLFLYLHPSQSDEICTSADMHYLLTSPANDELMMVTRYAPYPEEDDDYDEWTTDDDDPDDYLPADIPDNVGDGDDEIDRYGIDSESDDDGGGYGRESQVLTSKFRVFKAKEDRDGWDEVDINIGDFALFLGFNTATWISTRDHHEVAPNSIYFSDDVTEKHEKRKLAGADMGVYNLTTQTINPLYCTSSVHKNPSLIFPLPIWILPSNY